MDKQVGEVHLRKHTRHGEVKPKLQLQHHQQQQLPRVPKKKCFMI